MPVVLRHNNYEARFVRDGYVGIHRLYRVSGGTGLLGSGIPMTIGIYDAVHTQAILADAQRIAIDHQDALTACGYDKAAVQYVSQWHKEVAHQQLVL